MIDQKLTNRLLHMSEWEFSNYYAETTDAEFRKQIEPLSPEELLALLKRFWVSPVSGIFVELLKRKYPQYLGHVLEHYYRSKEISHNGFNVYTEGPETRMQRIFEKELNYKEHPTAYYEYFVSSIINCYSDYDKLRRLVGFDRKLSDQIIPRMFAEERAGQFRSFVAILKGLFHIGFFAPNDVSWKRAVDGLLANQDAYNGNNFLLLMKAFPANNLVSRYIVMRATRASSGVKQSILADRDVMLSMSVSSLRMFLSSTFDRGSESVKYTYRYAAIPPAVREFFIDLLIKKGNGSDIADVCEQMEKDGEIGRSIDMDGFRQLLEKLSEKSDEMPDNIGKIWWFNTVFAGVYSPREIQKEAFVKYVAAKPANAFVWMLENSYREYMNLVTEVPPVSNASEAKVVPNKELIEQLCTNAIYYMENFECDIRQDHFTDNLANMFTVLAPFKYTDDRYLRQARNFADWFSGHSFDDLIEKLRSACMKLLRANKLSMDQMLSLIVSKHAEPPIDERTYPELAKEVVDAVIARNLEESHECRPIYILMAEGVMTIDNKIDPQVYLRRLVDLKDSYIRSGKPEVLLKTVGKSLDSEKAKGDRHIYKTLMRDLFTLASKTGGQPRNVAGQINGFF